MKSREQLYHALVKTGFNQSAAARVVGVSRETVRQWLRDCGHFSGLIEWAVRCGLATKEQADALSALAALAPANSQPANHIDTGLAPEDAKSHEIRHLRSVVGRPIFAGEMSTVAQAVPQSSTIRLDGANREFAKRVALEVALKLGLPREDMSSVVARMLDFFQHEGDPASVAEMLIAGQREKDAAE